MDGDDGYDRPNWNLYFLDNTGIVAKAENSSRSPPQFEGYAVAVDGVAEQYFTKVKCDNKILNVAISKQFFYDMLSRKYFDTF